MTRTTSRRAFVELAACGLGAAALPGCGSALAPAPRPSHARAPAPETPLRAAPLERVRVGFVGVGGMGSAHVLNLLTMDAVDLVAVADIVPAHAERARSWATERGRPAPTLYTDGERDFERMIGEEALDLVITATPWEWHVPVMLRALESGVHGATEVPAALTVDDCWALVEASERASRHCVMLENCIYDRLELMTLAMVRAGALGEIVHGQGGYLHDLRAIKFARDGEGLWRRRWDTLVDGNLYPTHGLGPVAACMDIHRGDRLERLVSMSGPSRGLADWARTRVDEADPRRAERYVAGDVNVTLIQTARGRTITLGHDTNLPRPYSRGFTIQGTRGIVEGSPERIHIEGRSPEHAWESVEAYRDEHEHPLWRAELASAHERPGHGGMDYLELSRLVHCLREGLPVDMNVYDAAALSSIIELSARSVAARGAPQDIPDFTRGRWQAWTRGEVI
ncbi:Gfo/Idh/MocA family protein [Sandaracinus amylolyticus]|nr:Gfo/Idh/MocA family oxidoreductase [Sandaracinus amylolyticus]